MSGEPRAVGKSSIDQRSIKYHAARGKKGGAKHNPL